MECPEIFHADSVVERLHRLGKGPGRPEVVARREAVARVDADSHPRLVLDALDDVPELLEPAADDVPRTRHVLQHRDDLLGPLVGPVQHLGYPRARLPHVRPAAAPRVEVVQAYPQLVAPPQVVQEVLEGLLSLGVVGLGEVDEVAAVREGVLCRVVGVGGGEGAVLVSDVRG